MGKLYTLYAAEAGELVNEKMLNADVVMSPTQIIKDDPGIFHIDEQVQPLLSSGTQNDGGGGGCTLAGPGRGDCEHYIGISTSHPEDEYGKPNGWCWSCWKGHQIDKLRQEVQALEAWQSVAAESNRDLSYFLQQTFPSLGLDGGMPADNVRRAMESQMAASEALFGFMGWLTTRDEAVTFSGHHNAGIAADLVALFCKVNNLAEPRDHWDKKLVHPKECCPDKSDIVGEVTEEDRPPSSWQFSLEQILSKLSGDLSHDNVAKAKELLKQIIG